MRLNLVAMLLIAVSATALPGCGAAGPAITPAPETASAGFRSANAALSGGARNLVYVSDQLQKAVLAFPASERAKNPNPVETLSLGVIPEGVWVDRNGILYVGVSGHSSKLAGQVEEFKPGASTPFQTITSGISQPASLVVDAKGTLYVDQIADTTVEILEYLAGQTSPTKTLVISGKSEPVAGGLTLDDSGNLYVHTLFVDDAPSHVFRFAPGATIAEDLHLRGLGNVTGLSGDASGNLYVAVLDSVIAVYPPGQTRPSRKIGGPPSSYFANFVATRGGKLYVAQQNPEPSDSSLLEYAVGGSQPVNVLSGHLQAPVSAALRAAAF